MSESEQKARSDLFADPENLPRVEEVLAEYQRIKGGSIGVSTNFARKVLEIAESGERAVIRLAQPGAAARPDLRDVCIFCDEPHDNCASCDASDFVCELGDGICLFEDSTDVECKVGD